MTMDIILAPTNLGLSPLYVGHEPGTWRAPDVLMAAGLADVLGDDIAITALPRPGYCPEPQAGTLIRNRDAIRALQPAACRGCGAECRKRAVCSGPWRGLFNSSGGVGRGTARGACVPHPFDGHSDFRHPGNYESSRIMSGVAGMDLALATGRGESCLTQWPECEGPLVQDEHVIQIGERESHDVDFAWPDIARTAITRLDVFTFQKSGVAGAQAAIQALLNRQSDAGFWIHFDVDVLDQIFMPAVDCPGSPGLSPEDMVALLDPLVSDGRCQGMTVSIYDPSRDPDGASARTLVSLLGQLTYRAAEPSGKER